MTEFLQMGGYARFVWPSVGLVLAVLIWNIWSAQRQLRSARERVRRSFAAAEARAKR